MIATKHHVSESTPTVDRQRRFLPSFGGEFWLEHIPQDFVERIIQRVQTGFLQAGMKVRANYVAIPQQDGSVRVTANDFWTAINVGLNDVVVRREAGNVIRYEVSFGTWAKYCVFLGGVIFLLVLIVQFAAHLAGFSVTPSQFVLGMLIAAFFGLVWPWLLIEMHKRPAARCLDRILRETLIDSGVYP